MDPYLSYQILYFINNMNYEYELVFAFRIEIFFILFQLSFYVIFVKNKTYFSTIPVHLIHEVRIKQTKFIFPWLVD